MKVSTLLQELNQACLTLIGTEYIFSGTGSKANLHEELRKKLDPLLKKSKLEYASWRVTTNTSRDSMLRFETIFNIDCDFKDRKRTLNRIATLLAVNIIPVIDTPEDITLANYIKLLTISKLERDYEAIEKQQKKMKSDLDELNLSAVNLYAKIQSYKNKK